MTNAQIAFFVYLGFFVLLVFAYGFYAAMYFNSRKLIDRMYAYQQKYKTYSVISFTSLIKPFELLGKREAANRNEKNLRLVIDYMQNFDLQYKKQLSEIWRAIDQLTNLKMHFNFVQTKKTYRLIDQQFAKLDGWLAEFRDLTKDSSVYQNDASRILVQYRHLVDGLIGFLKDHILPKYDSSVFKDFLANISRNFEEANLALMLFENERYLKCLENLRYAIYTLLTYANRLYILDKKTDYLKFLAQEIRLLYEKAESEKSLANLNKLNELYRNLNDANDAIAKIDGHLHLLQFKEGEELIINLLKILQPLHANLATENEAKSIISLGLNNFVRGVNSLEQKSNTLMDAIKKLNKIFENHAHVLEKINQLRNLFNSIRETINELQRFNINNPNDNYSRLLEKITGFIDLVARLKDCINDLVGTMEKEINLYKNTVHKINDLNLKYSQLQKYAIDYDLRPDAELWRAFREYKNLIAEKTVLANDDYRHIVAGFDALAEKADQLFLEVLRPVVELAALKQMTAAALMFLNKYRYEDREIEKNIDLIQNDYLGARYESALQRCIRILTLIKRSAEKNNLTLN